MATQTINYGGYSVDPNWNYVSAGDKNIYFNPNDRTQNFSVSSQSDAQLQEFLTQGGRNAQVNF